jgi:CBS-domain-containing membrane protein
MIGRVYRTVPVVDDGVPVGIITNVDLVERGGLRVRMELLPSLDHAERQAHLALIAQQAKTAADVMTPAPTVVSAAASLPEVAAVMASRRFKRLPVVDDGGAIVGMISRLDLLHTVAGGFAEQGESAARPTGLAADTPVSEVMRRDVPTVHPESPLPVVLQAVASTRLNRAVVVDADRRVMGQITDAELLDRVTPALRPSALRSLMHRLPFVHLSEAVEREEQHATARTAAELMSRNVATATPDTPLQAAISEMLAGNHKLVAVVDADRRLVGVLDRADILRGLVNQPVDPFRPPA